MKLFYNAHFWQDGSFSNELKSILIDKGKILKLDYCNDIAGSDIQRIDLGGTYVFPGFIDTHTHSFEGGLYSLMIDLGGARSLADVFALLASGCKDKGNFIFAWNFDETSIAERRFPTRAELDAIVGDKNLVLRRVDGHSCILNTFACHSILDGLAKVHCEDEVFRGFENDKAVHWFHNNVSDELILKAYHAASSIALKGGFTTVHTMVGDANMSVGHYALLSSKLGDFPVEYQLYPQSFNIDAALDLGAKRIGGCILADGSIGSLTAALYEPYAGKPLRGTLYQSNQFWKDFIYKAHSHDLQVAVHCIGDRAISQINDIYLDLAINSYKDLRHQLIHCEITDDFLLNQIQASDAVPVMQPMFDHLWGGSNGFYSRLLGQERLASMNRFGTMDRKGIKLTGSSDWYITELDIRKSLFAAMHHHNPQERLSLQHAVNIYTVNAARLSKDESRLGSLSVGMDADFTVLNYIPSTAALGDQDKVCKVIKGAEIVYENM